MEGEKLKEDVLDLKRKKKIFKQLALEQSEENSPESYCVSHLSSIIVEIDSLWKILSWEHRLGP